jgi:hypothetical protein
LCVIGYFSLSFSIDFSLTKSKIPVIFVPFYPSKYRPLVDLDILPYLVENLRSLMPILIF